MIEILKGIARTRVQMHENKRHLEKISCAENATELENSIWRENKNAIDHYDTDMQILVTSDRKRGICGWGKKYGNKQDCRSEGEKIHCCEL